MLEVVTLGESIRLVDDLFEVANQENLDVIILQCGKAFDSVRSNFTDDTLMKFGFGENFIPWIKIMSDESQSYVMKDGRSTGYFPLQGETRQGDPLVSILFTLARIRADKAIAGFSIHDVQIKLTAYADYTAFM